MSSYSALYNCCKIKYANSEEICNEVYQWFDLKNGKGNHLPHSSFPQLSGSEAYKRLHSCQCSGPSPHYHTYFCNVPKKKTLKYMYLFKS